MKIATFNVNAFAARLPALSAQRDSRAGSKFDSAPAGWSAGVKKTAGMFTATLTVICHTAADQTDMVWSHQLAPIHECRKPQDCEEGRFPSTLHVMPIRRADALETCVGLVITEAKDGQ
jgi:hypothetical protein